MTTHAEHHVLAAAGPRSGYEAHAAHGHAEVFRRRFWLSLILSVPVFVYSEPVQEL
jgi:Cu2+-exporting ATPase